MRLPLALGLSLAVVPLFAADPPLIKDQKLAERVAEVDRHAGPQVQDLVDLYKDLHQHPELSLKEERSAALMAKALKAAGFEVTEGVGGTGVVGVLKNGDGPTVLVRTDMDALPIAEQTGLPYCSKVMTRDRTG